MCFICTCMYVRSYLAAIVYWAKYNAGWGEWYILATCCPAFIAITTVYFLFKFKIYFPIPVAKYFTNSKCTSMYLNAFHNLLLFSWKVLWTYFQNVLDCMPGVHAQFTWMHKCPYEIGTHTITDAFGKVRNLYKPGMCTSMYC